MVFCALIQSLLSSPPFPNADIYGSSCAPWQKILSAKIEAKACRDLLDPSLRERHRVADFSLNRIHGTGAWLFALPDSIDSDIPSPLSQVSRPDARLRRGPSQRNSGRRLAGNVRASLQLIRQILLASSPQSKLAKTCSKGLPLNALRLASPCVH